MKYDSQVWKSRGRTKRTFEGPPQDTVHHRTRTASLNKVHQWVDSGE